MDFFSKDTTKSREAIEQAQYLAFAPVLFQAARSLRNLGILALVEAHQQGISQADIVKQLGLSEYGVRVLLEAGLGGGLFTCENGLYKTTKLGYFILNDPMTIANMDFVHDICYKGMFELEKSIVTGKPEGLKVFGEKWKTVYEALSSLPPAEQKSWFAFDHFYSSDSFPEVLPFVFKDHPKKILDIGGNTGKWVLECLKYDSNVQMGMVDLPGQLRMAQENIKRNGFEDRVTYYEKNVLDRNEKLPTGYDIIWMSQFLDCFSEEEIVSILTRCCDALDNKGQVLIMEPFWDRQVFRSSAFSLQMTSLYFTNIANGNSQMYHSDLFVKLVERAGLKVVEQVDHIGVSHSLLRCSK